jgi:hypothetical protein
METYILNQNSIKLPAPFYKRFKGKEVIIFEKENRIIIEQKKDAISHAKGFLSNSKFGIRDYLLNKEEDRKLENEE